MAVNMIAAYVMVLYYDKIDISEGTDVNKSNRLKECMTCH